MQSSPVLPPTTSFGLLLGLDDGADDVDASVLPFLKTFGADANVLLRVWISSKSALTSAHVGERITGCLTRLGMSEQTCPDVFVASESADYDLSRAVASSHVLLSSQFAASPEVQQLVRDLGKPVVPPTPEWISLAMRTQREHGFCEEMLESMKRRVSTQLAVQQLDVFLEGYRHFARTGETPEPAFFSMRNLYMMTNGAFIDEITQATHRAHPPPPMATAQGVMGTLDGAAVCRNCETLEKDGVIVAAARLDSNLIERLLGYAYTHPSLPCKSRNPKVDGSVVGRPTLYDPANPVAVRYDFPEAELLKNEDVLRLALDPTVLATARSYLKCEPVFDLATLWWSTSHFPEADVDAAQLFHFDLPRLKFVKFFFYLTDVTPETGPHCFVRGSHRNKPRPLLRDDRISDDEIASHYPAEDRLEISGSRGTILVADTSAFHKGKVLTTGHRLVLQFQYTTSLFGCECLHTDVRPSVSPEIARQLEQWPRVFGRILGT